MIKEVKLEELGDALDYVVEIQLRTRVSMIKEVLLKSILEAGKKQQKEWLTRLQKRLSTPVPKVMLHKKRKPRTRLFPYMVTGELRNSITVGVRRQDIDDNTVLLVWWAKFLSNHAYFTSKVNKAKDKPNWLDWKDDVFYRKGRSNVPSFKGSILRMFKNNMKLLMRGALK